MLHVRTRGRALANPADACLLSRGAVWRIAEFLSDVLFNKILVALVLAYPIAAIWFFQRLRREEERERETRARIVEHVN